MNNVAFLIMMIVITAICLGGIMMGYLEDREGMLAMSCFALFLVILFGWMAFGMSYPMSSKTELITPNPSMICRNARTVFIQVDDKTVSSDSYELYVASNDCLRVVKYIPMNAYGKVLVPSVTYTIVNKNP